MYELTREMKKLAKCYKPIETEGLTLYPMKVNDYEDYMIARQAIGFMNQSLPIEHMSMPLLSAFYKIDYDHAMNGEPPTGLFASAMLGLALALRLNQNGESFGETMKKMWVLTDKQDQGVLKGVVCLIDGVEEKVITPIQYARLRVVIAAQNGITIRDELDNPELVQAEADLAEAKMPKLDYDPDQLVKAAAALTGKDEDEIYEWPILKLLSRLNSFKRIIDYMVCSSSEAQGTKWTGGNPTPHPWFEKKKEGSDALIAMGNFMGGAGLQAMKNAGELD